MNKRIFILAGLLFGAIVLTTSSACQNHQPKDNYQLVWSDEFNYEGLPDAAKWSYDTVGNATGWGNNELQYYTAAKLKNAKVHEGKLIISTLKDSTGGKQFTSARLRSKDKGDWLYGKVEVCAKLPRGRGLWPAIWMLPTDWEYGGWPASGEIDIMEQVGYEPDSIFCTIHTKSYNHTIHTQRGSSIAVPDCADAFHRYQMEWDKDEIRLLVDDKLVFSFKNEKTSPNEWPFDKRFHLLLNVAVGGNWGGAKGVDDSVFPQAMEVDYVRVYQKN